MSSLLCAYLTIGYVKEKDPPVGSRGLYAVNWEMILYPRVSQPALPSSHSAFTVLSRTRAGLPIVLN